MFADLQRRLVDQWPEMTMRTVAARPRTVVVLSSVSLDLPDHMTPLLPAYEERYLVYVLLLAKARTTNVVYVTSQPMLPRLVDYYLSLVPGVDREHMRRRLTVLSVGDGSHRPLTCKVLERPRLVARLRSLAHRTERSVLLPFVTTGAEAELAVRLDVPIYGPDPALARLGTKSGSREVFAAAGVAHPAGVAGVRTARDVAAAATVVQRRTGCAEVMLKLDDSVSGLGNAVLALPPECSVSEVRRALDGLRPEDSSLTGEHFLAQLEATGGIVEERLIGQQFRSPSVQLRASPLGEVEVLSTHDQVLGGPHGQTYLGCRFPAAPSYARAMAEPAARIGQELAARGVTGRFAVDFVATRTARGPWQLSAVEINLRSGGTTHPMLTLQGLTDGSYDAAAGAFRSPVGPRHYVASDHLAGEHYERLTPDDLLDVVHDSSLGWDPDSATGVAFHMASAIAAAGCVGITAIGATQAQADQLYRRARQVLDRAANGLTVRRVPTARSQTQLEPAREPAELS